MLFHITTYVQAIKAIPMKAPARCQLAQAWVLGCMVAGSDAAPSDATPTTHSMPVSAQGKDLRFNRLLANTGAGSSWYVSTTSLHHRLVPTKYVYPIDSTRITTIAAAMPVSL